ncbi:putative aspartyl protease precursor [Cladorrhinum samala]|uniref:Aspartyl protease n=1 Tax=Cladorrhinum samala TaxID=585594 RepID=A0AAV9HJ87_9PEZI|nr:putative aspartyl protease precursor [Cladorrhinum samala]
MAIMSSKLLSLLTVLPAAVLAGSDPVTVSKGIVRYGVTAQQAGDSLTKRQLGTGAAAQRGGSLYTVQVKFGTPGQWVPIQIDTSTAEMWANPTCGNSADRSFCQAQPRFTYSTTLTDLGTVGQAVTRSPTADGSANFVYVADYIGVGNARVTQQIFGAGYATTLAMTGTMGLGPSLQGWQNGYPTFIDSLYSQGFINSRAFSLDLQSLSNQDGSLIFGGIDTQKYIGDLVKLPIIPAGQSPDGFTRYWIYVNEISVNKEDGTVATVYETPEGGRGQAVFIDSGATLSTLPTNIFNQLLAAFPSAQYVAASNGYLIDCEVSESASIDFVFAGKTISVPLKDFIWKAGADMCYLGAKEGSLPALGANFLRAAYVVFDWDNRNIHLAQSSSCGSNLVAIGRGANSVPSVTGGCLAPVRSTTSSEIASSTTTEAATSTTETVSTTETATETASTTGTATESVTETVSTTETATETASTTETATESATETVSTTESAVETTTASATETETETETATETASTTEGAVETTTASATETETETETETATETASTTESAVETTTASATETETVTATQSSDDDSCTETASEIITETATSSAVETTSASGDIPATTTTAGPDVTSPPITGTVGPTSIPDRTITYTSVYTSTITSCAPTVTNCPSRPHVTVVTEVITATTAVCPETTGTYTLTIPGASGSSSVVTMTLTPHPVVPIPVPTSIIITPRPESGKAQPTEGSGPGNGNPQPTEGSGPGNGNPQPTEGSGPGNGNPQPTGGVPPTQPIPSCPGCNAPGAITTLIPSYGLPTPLPTGGSGGPGNGNGTVVKPTTVPIVSVGGAGRVSGLGWASALFSVGLAALAVGL